MRAPRVVIASAVLVGLSLIAGSVVSADDWMSPEPASFHARGMSLVAEIFPPESRIARVLLLLRARIPGHAVGGHAAVEVERGLANERMPVDAVVSMDGWLVTLNNWGGMGQGHSIAVYDQRGRLVADWSGDQLFAHPALQNIARQRMSSSSIWWNEKAKYYFSRANTLFIGIAQDAMVRIDLAAGTYRVGAPTTFPDYAAVAADTNALTNVWKTSLRFSSITDILIARAGRP